MGQAAEGTAPNKRSQRALLQRWCAGCDGLLRARVNAGTRADRLGLCPVCARTLANQQVVGWVEPPPGLVALAVLWPYKPPMSGVVVAGKNQGRRRILAAAGHELGEWARRSQDPAPVASVVTWVPANPQARRRRGFDQGQVLAAQVGRSLGIAHRRLLLRRSTGTRAGAGRAERLRGPDLRVPARPPSTVFLVDDVCTTGASLRCAAHALQRAGAEQVVGLALAIVDGQRRWVEAPSTYRSRPNVDQQPTSVD